MTFCVAWKTDTSAYIIADSAITRLSKENSDALETTSFLEKQGQLSQHKNVIEGGYKIFSGDSYAIGMAGDAHFATTVVNLLHMHLSYGRTAEQSIRMTIDNFTDFSQRPHIELVIITYTDKPLIYTLTNRGDEFECIPETLVLLGSPTTELIKYTTNFHEAFMKSWKSESNYSDRDDILFARMLGLLQSYGIHRYTMENGIGGTYSGVMVNKSGVLKQPDTCFLISGENPAFDTLKVASVHSNENHLCIINSDTAQIIIRNLAANADDITARNVAEQCRNVFDSGKFKYIILINIRMHTVCIIDMNYELHHMHLNIDVRESKQGTIGFLISNELAARLNNNYESSDGAAICYYSFMPPSSKQLSFIEDNIEKIRLGKMFDLTVEKYKFIVYEKGALLDWFYGNKESIFSFFKHYKNKELLRVINLESDTVIGEFKNGALVFPELGVSTEELFENTNTLDKIKDENIYMFETYINGNSDPYTINVLSHNIEEARKQALETLSSEYDEPHELIFAGKRFYHPAYYWAYKE